MGKAFSNECIIDIQSKLIIHFKNSSDINYDSLINNGTWSIYVFFLIGAREQESSFLLPYMSGAFGITLCLCLMLL